MIDADDRELLATGLRHATAAHTGGALDAALADLGWADALAVDPRTAVALLFELQGGAVATSSALDAVLAHALGAGGEVAVVLPPLGCVEPPGRVAGEGLAVAGLATAAVTRRSRALVATADGGVAEVVAADLTCRPVTGLDPALGLVEVVGGGIRAGTTSSAPWPAAVAAGQVALAHELVGVARTMLDQAREHALGRVQFGRPVAGFQAVRHRLAEAYVAVEAADAVAHAAWDDGSPLLAAVAKAVAGRSARTVARHAQQVLAGIGFTTEHPLHRSVRRTVVLDHLLGDARTLTRAVGAGLLGERRLPALLPL